MLFAKGSVLFSFYFTNRNMTPIQIYLTSIFEIKYFYRGPDFYSKNVIIFGNIQVLFFGCMMTDQKIFSPEINKSYCCK